MTTFITHVIQNSYKISFLTIIILSYYSYYSFSSPGLHFHLAASINAETDIPLVPSLAGGGRFILHWLHNKEMHFTSQAEAILHDLTKKVIL